MINHPTDSVVFLDKLPEGTELSSWADIFEPFAGEEEPGTQTFYVRPGGGQAFYFDMLEPKRVSREVNQILQAVPLVQQNGLEYKGPFIEIVMTQGRVIK